MGSIDTMPTGQMNGSLASYVVDEHPLGEPSPMRAICIGAGARGLDVAYKIEKRMRNVAFQIYEKNDALGGTWLENRSVFFIVHPQFMFLPPSTIGYPGCTCDIPAHIYQFSWAPNPDWSEL